MIIVKCNANHNHTGACLINRKTLEPTLNLRRNLHSDRFSPRGSRHDDRHWIRPSLPCLSTDSPLICRCSPMFKNALNTTQLDLPSTSCSDVRVRIVKPYRMYHGTFGTGWNETCTRCRVIHAPRRNVVKHSVERVSIGVALTIASRSRC